MTTWKLFVRQAYNYKEIKSSIKIIFIRHAYFENSGLQVFKYTNMNKVGEFQVKIHTFSSGCVSIGSMGSMEPMDFKQL